MKSLKLMTLTVASALLLATAGCDITTEPKSTVTDANIFEDTNSYTAFIAKLYAGLGVTGQQGPHGDTDLPGFDEGFSQYVRLLWMMQELPTDMAVIGWNDQGIREISAWGWATQNGFIGYLYNRVFFQAMMANEFLRETTADKLAERGHESLAEDIALYRAEARFLRALSYWHGFDAYGDIPLVDESFPLGAQPPQQETRERIFAWVVDELNAIRGELPVAGAAQYGRADQGVVAMVLAKMYMNAGFYTGVEMWSDAMVEVDRVLAGPYQLDDNYQELFLADNHTSPELIFAVPQDGDFIRTWGGSTFLAHAACGGNMSAADYGLDFCWGGTRVKPELVGMFPNPADSPDSRAIFWSDGQNLEITDPSNFSDGWAGPKYSNKTSTGGEGSNPTHVSADFPMFRLGDAYLMYAELALRGGGGSTGQALDYVNALRERAYGDQSGNITAGELTLDFIIDERARELWWEAHRRMDLLRFGLFTGGDYLWSWKGGVLEGRAGDEYRAIYPIPATEMIANPLLTQNPGY